MNGCYPIEGSLYCAVTIDQAAPDNKSPLRRHDEATDARNEMGAALLDRRETASLAIISRLAAEAELPRDLMRRVA